jgi:hypothetical protein
MDMRPVIPKKIGRAALKARSLPMGLFQASARAMLAGFGAAHYQPAAEEFLVVQFFHGPFRFLNSLHLYKRETFRALVMAVTYNFRILNVSDSVEQLKKIAFGCVERQVANVQTRGTDFNPLRFACRSRRLDTVARAWFCPRCAISKKCRNPLPECLFWLLHFFSLTTRGAVATASGAAARTLRASPS